MRHAFSTSRVGTDAQADTVAARVQRGAALLDEKMPDWWQNVNLATLNMGEPEGPCSCVLTQIFGRYVEGLNALGDAVGQLSTIKHGFEKEIGDDEAVYQGMGTQWAIQVHLRRLRSRVQAGARYLDTKLPGWRARIETKRLWMASCGECILGQLFGSFFEAVTHFEDDPAKLGFTLTFGHGINLDFHWETLRDLWIDEINHPTTFITQETQP